MRSQELGASNSSYSIANQLRVNPAFGKDASFADVENIVSKMRTEWKVSCRRALRPATPPIPR